MNLQPVYANGFERRAFFAFNFRLHPITLGHIQLLAELDSSIPFPPSKITLDDVSKLIAVGSFPHWQDARDHIATPDGLSRFVAAVVGSSQDAVREAVKTAGDYVAYYLARPRSRSARADFYECRIPWWWSYAEFLQTELHRSEADAWSTICADAFAYYASFAVRNGDETIMTVREAYIEEQVESGKTMADLFAEGVL